MAKIEFHPAAQAEYENALRWYFDRSPAAARRFEADIEETLNIIGSAIEACPKYDQTHRYCTLRRFPYSLVFSTSDSAIQIIAVVHASRRPGYWHGQRS